VLHQVVNDDPLAPHVLTPRVRTTWKRSASKSSKKEPSRRYQTAQELADELGRFLRDEPIKARARHPFRAGWRLVPAQPGFASLGASLVLVLTLGFSGTLWQWRPAMYNAKAEAKQRQPRRGESRARRPKSLRGSHEFGPARMG
jgi:hypothetical protein